MEEGRRPSFLIPEQIVSYISRVRSIGWSCCQCHSERSEESKTNGASSERELSNRKMNEAILIRHKSIPLSQRVEQSYSVSQSCSEVAPPTMPQLLEVAHSCEHGEDGLYQHSSVPLVDTADHQVRRIGIVRFCPLFTSSLAIPSSTFGRIEAVVSYHDHLLLKPLDERMEGSVVNVGRRGVPPTHQAPLVEHQAYLTSYDPHMVGDAEASYLTGRTASSLWVEQLYTECICKSKYCRLCQEAVGPLLVSSEQAEEACALREQRKQRKQVSLCTSVESTVAHPLEGKKHCQGNHFSWVKLGLIVLGHLLHRIVYSTEQLRDKILGSHGVLLAWCVVTTGYRRTL